jgi:transcription elongation factor Elf1
MEDMVDPEDIIGENSVFDGQEEVYAENCPVCGSPMTFIGNVMKFDADSVSNAIDNYMKGGVTMKDLQKNENDATITNMDKSNDDVTVSKAAVELVASVASTLVPHFILGGTTTSGVNSVTPELVKSDDSAEEIVEKSENTSKSVNEDSKLGGDEVNTDELLKSLSAMMDEKLNEFKEQITTTVDEKIEAVTKLAEESSEADETVVKKDESADDEKDALIKSLVEKVEALEAKSAVKKSIDADDESDEGEPVIKSTPSLWNGFFIPTEVVNALGYES